jgi:hypothetical protein
MSRWIKKSLLLAGLVPAALCFSPANADAGVMVAVEESASLGMSSSRADDSPSHPFGDRHEYAAIDHLQAHGSPVSTTTSTPTSASSGVVLAAAILSDADQPIPPVVARLYHAERLTVPLPPTSERLRPPQVS